MTDLHKQSPILSSDEEGAQNDSDGYRPAAISGHRELKLENHLVHHANDLRTVLNDVLRSDTMEIYYFLNEGALRRQVGIFRENFIPDMANERRIIYAMKANSRKRIMEILASEGIDGFDCASINEIDSALALPGIKPENVYFNNPIRKPQSITEALAREIRYFTVQSRSGVRKVLRGAQNFGSSVPVELVVRLETQNPEAAINLSEKFGCSQETAMELLRMGEKEGTELGLSMHTGSQNPDPRTFSDGINLLGEIARQIGGVSSLNLGGGLPVKQAAADHFDLKSYLRHISRSVNDIIPRTFKPGIIRPRIILEPGRALVAEAVTLAVPVIEMDRRGNRRRVAIGDGIFTSFSDAVIHKWRYNFKVFTKDGRKLSSHKSNFILFGETCDSGDKLGEYDLPDNLEEGDYLLVENGGAYMDAQRSAGFCGLSDEPIYFSYNIAA